MEQYFLTPKIFSCILENIKNNIRKANLRQHEVPDELANELGWDNKQYNSVVFDVLMEDLRKICHRYGNPKTNYTMNELSKEEQNIVIKHYYLQGSWNQCL